MSNPTTNTTQPKKKYEKSPDDVGAGWLRDGNSGQYISLSLDITPDMVGTRIPFVMFPKKSKTSDKQPDYTVLKSKKFNSAPMPAPGGKPAVQAAVAKVQKTAAPAVEPSDLDF